MDVKKWFSSTWVLILILGLFAAMFSLTLSFHNFDQYVKYFQQPTSNLNFLNGDLKDLDEQRNQFDYISTASQWVNNIIFNGFLGEEGDRSIWPYNSNNEKSRHEQFDHDRTVISPNLSTCHDSYAVPGKLIVNCCPPKRESEEPVIDFEFPSPSTLRVRRPAHLINDHEYIAKYKKAVAIMKSLPYTDPRNFMRQANMHCLYCTGSYNQKYSNSINVDIHKTWYFFPWHRMMIYFHEKIISNLIGDENFALPFWQWDSPDGMAIPNMYMEGSLFDKERNPSHLPPKIGNLNYDLTETRFDNDEMISRNLAFMYNQMVSGAKTSELFMGCPFKVGEAGICMGRGTIEAAPHNTMHSWVGSNFNPYRENMGVFYSAARDPTFYPHHANIDRLWEVWRELGNYKKDIVDPDWLNSYFYFHNEKSQLVRIKVHDVMNITKLGYRYQKVDLPWLNARPKPSIPPKIARNKLMTSTMNTKNNSTTYDQMMNKGLQLTSENNIELETSCFEPKGRKLDIDILRVRVYRPKKSRSKKEKEEEEEVLVIYGIDIKKDMYVKFDVYINLVIDNDQMEKNNTSSNVNIGPESREFAGTFVNLRHGVKMILNEGDNATSIMRHKKSNFKLGISELLEDLEADEDESILVTLVPRNGSGVNTTIDGIRIDHVRTYM